MTIHFIVSVGTSIIGKYEETYKTKLKNFRVNLEMPIPEPAAFYRSIKNKEREFQIPACQGAEEKSIRKVLEKGELSGEKLEMKNSHFHLISTDTSECRFCASYLGHVFLKDAPYVDYHVPKHLGKADDENFVHKGIPELLSEVAGILDVADRQDHKAVIIPTGGYKAIIPYMTIAAILYSIPIYYIYEDSESLLELPAPPLGVDGAAFRSALVLLENIQGERTEDSEPYRKELSNSFQSLVYEEDGRYQYTAFGKRLKTMFTAQPTSPLAVRVLGNSLIPRLGDFREIFREMTRLGETIWIGDKAPEMADHARYHHVNLLAYAELLLAPLLQVESGSGFLSEEELFLLLGMIYLHDCGHSRCMLPDENGEPIPLLPTEIRNFHNFLGYLRMTDSAFAESLERQGCRRLSSDPKTLEDIALLSMYHRKKMPLLKGEYTAPNGKTFKALKEQSVERWGERVRGELLVALFRIIDGMDKQIGRAGDAVEISMRAESILADLGHLMHRFRRLETMIENHSPAAKLETDKILDEIHKSYLKQESVSSGEESVPTVSHPCMGHQAGTCMPDRKPSSRNNNAEIPVYIHLRERLNEKCLAGCLPLAWEYLEARVRFMFQALQPTYYYSDLLLKMPKVSVSDSEGDGIRHISINYDENRDEETKDQVLIVWDKIAGWINGNMKEEEPERKVAEAPVHNAFGIVEGIRDEYCSKKNMEVAQILYKHGLTVSFQFNGIPAPCWQKEITG